MHDNIKRLNVPVPASLHTELKVTSAIQGKTLEQWVHEAIQDKLQKETEIKNNQGGL